jgi:hypothetical protein
MIVRLTRQQHQACKRYANVDDDLLGWLDRDVSTASKNRVDVAMPAIAWLRLRNALFPNVYSVKGFQRKEAPLTASRALSSIQAAINLREKHPAMRNAGAIGIQMDMLPVWRLPSPRSDFIYSPYPGIGTFMVLMPEHITEGGRRVTFWHEATSFPKAVLLQESTHLVFL